MTGRVLQTTILAVVLGVTLAGCVTPTPPEKESTMSHVEAKQQLESLLEDAQQLVGGDWESGDGGAEACTLPDGGEGAAYGLLRLGPGVPSSEQQKLVDAVVAAWSARDVEAVVSTLPEVKGVIVTQVRFPSTDVEPDGFYVQLWLSERASTVGGQTRCASGDPVTINSP